MKNLVAIISLFCLGAQAQDMDYCTDQASLYGVDSNAPKISQDCGEIVINQALHHAIDYSSDNYIQAFASQNILHLVNYANDEQGQPQMSLSGFIAGRYTGFENIQAIDIDEINKMVYVLNRYQDGSQSVTSVQADREGSLAARAKLYTEEIEEAINIKTDRENEELYVMGENWIKVFNIDAHHKSTKPELAIHVKRNLIGNQTELYSIKDLAVVGEQILVLDSNRVLAFPRNFSDSDLRPKRVLSDTIPANAVGMDLDGDKLIITLSDLSVLEVSLK